MPRTTRRALLATAPVVPNHRPHAVQPVWGKPAKLLRRMVAAFTLRQNVADDAC